MSLTNKQSIFIVSDQVHINAPAEKLWTLISDSDKNSRLVGLSPITYQEIPVKPGKIRKLIRTRLGPFQGLYEEAPSEWVQDNYYSFERKFQQGILKYMKMTTMIKNSSDNGFDLFKSFDIVAKHDWMKPLLRILFKKIALKSLNLIKQSASLPISDSFQMVPIPIFEKNELENSITFLEHFNKFSPDPALNEKLIHYILVSPEENVTRMRPYQIADRMGENRRSVLELMLRATQQGFLEMKWEIICPSCRGGKSSVSSLWDLELQAHCSSCNITYDAEFDRNVELVFYPHQSFRQVNQNVYCIGSPARTPHILAQLNVKRNESLRVPFHFRQEGVHRIYSPQSEQILEIHVRNEPPAPTVITYDARYTNNQITIHLGNHEIILSNESIDEDMLIRLERTDWLDNVTTASEVTAMQEFRKLFSSEVLKPGVEMGIKNLAVLFTDIKDSTLFYNVIGDAAAFGVVKDHFDVLNQAVNHHQGTIVKTIGDAIMAVFPLPSHAVASAIEIQQRIKILNSDLPEHKQIIVKSGIHSGHVLAVNLNNNLDYFGHTVNLAARTNSNSYGQDIVITDDMYQILEVKQCIEASNARVTQFSSAIKGFPNEYCLHRITL